MTSTQEAAQAVYDYVKERSYLPKGLSDLVADLMATFGAPEAPVSLDPLDINSSPGWFKYDPTADGVWVVPGPSRLIEIGRDGVVDIETVDGTREARFFYAGDKLMTRVARIYTEKTTVEHVWLHK